MGEIKQIMSVFTDSFNENVNDSQGQPILVQNDV